MEQFAGRAKYKDAIFADIPHVVVQQHPAFCALASAQTVETAVYGARGSSAEEGYKELACLLKSILVILQMVLSLLRSTLSRAKLIPSAASSSLWDKRGLICRYSVLWRGANTPSQSQQQGLKLVKLDDGELVEREKKGKKGMQFLQHTYLRVRLREHQVRLSRHFRLREHQLQRLEHSAQWCESLC